MELGIVTSKLLNVNVELAFQHAASGFPKGLILKRGLYLTSSIYKFWSSIIVQIVISCIGGYQGI